MKCLFDNIEGKALISNVYFPKASGGTYEGEYVEDKKNGKGKYTYPNKDVYKGEWKDNLRHGQGTYSYKDDGGV